MFGSSYSKDEVALDFTERDRQLMELWDEQLDKPKGKVPKAPSLDYYDEFS